VRWLPWLLLAACSSGPGAPTRPGPVGPAAPTAPAAPPTERECDELITHAVALGIDEQAARPAEPQATEADHEAIRRGLHEDFMAGCRALPRDRYRCAIAAPTLTAMAACEPVGPAPPAQRTPSSSTSNSSVAPAGMTPPAPRSP
jgi:hypothetical protein